MRKYLILLVMLLGLVSSSFAGTWTQTTQAEFEAGVGFQIDTEKSPDDVLLGVESLPEPKADTRERTFAAGSSQAVGVLAADGTYLYGKSWSTYDGSDHTITRIGSGYNGTTEGTIYGDVANVGNSLSMTYHTDGYLYNGRTTTGLNLQRIDPDTGDISWVTLASPLMVRNTASDLGSAYNALLITSDGRYIYNLAYSINGGGYNGFTLKVFDTSVTPWSLVRKLTSGTTSFYTDGIFADGKYIYAIQWGGSHYIRRIDVVTGAQHDQWVCDQASTSIINGQYDWVNNKVWLGDLVGPDIYRYSGKYYFGSGFLESSNFDTGEESIFQTIWWNGQYSSEQGTSLKFQIKTADIEANLAGAAWVGSDGTSGTYYETTYSEIVTDPGPPPAGTQWIRYKAYLDTTNTTYTPSLEDISISFYPAVNDPPSAFGLTSPASGIELTTLTPEFSWTVSTDPNGDGVTYTLWYDTDEDFLTKVEKSPIAGSPYTLPENLSDNTKYYWKVKAVDTWGAETWANETNRYFYTNLVNEAPSSPTIKSPPDGSETVTDLTPDCVVYNAVDPDPNDTLTYEFEVYDNDTYSGSPVASAAGVAEGAGETSWEVTPGLIYNTTYYWQARANDGAISGGWARASFTLNNGWVQTDWSGGSGQNVWLDESGYLSGDKVDDTVEGEIAIEVEVNPEPKASTRERTFAAGDSQAVGVLATDGTYLYGKSWATYDGSDHTITRIGSGYNGTTEGTIYGDIANVGYSLSMTYHTDGYLYNGRTTTGSNLQRIDPDTGVIDYVTLASPLMVRNTGNDLGGAYNELLITSDGTYIYNLAYSINGGGYNGFTLKVYDTSVTPWSLERKLTSGTTSFYADGIFADGKYIYAIEWGGSRRIRRIDAVTGAEHDEWTSDQASTSVINGQYDWVNNKVWLGDLFGSDIYRYSGRKYFAEGGVVSSKFDAGAETNFSQITWNADAPSDTYVKFQIKTAENAALLDVLLWCGPDGTDITFYEIPGTQISTAHNGDRWIQYKLFLSTNDEAFTPTLEDVTITMYPTWEHPPESFSLLSPAKGQVIQALNVPLDWDDAIDPDEGDEVTYTLWYSETPDFTTKTEIDKIAQSTYTVSGLSEDTSYYWKVKAVDKYGAETWSIEDDWYFSCNANNNIPVQPVLKSPADGSIVSSLNPTLEVYNSTDADPYDTLTYDFEVYKDAGLTILVTSESAVVEGGDGATSWIVIPMLKFNQTYYWRARANDGFAYSNWMNTASFSITSSGEWIQTDWSGGDGQDIWLSTVKYLSSDKVDDTVEGELILEVEVNPEPKASTCKRTFAAGDSQAVGVLATDGTYLYGKSWATYDGADHIITRIGSGYNSTIEGTICGDVANVGYSLSMTYHSDGYLYNGRTTTGSNLQRIDPDPDTGVIDYVTLASPLMARNTGNNLGGAYNELLITSDGTYIYNLAYSINGGGYNGFTLKVYDTSVTPWSLERKLTSGTTSFYTDGIFADGKYIYAIQWGGSHYIRRIDVVTGAQHDQWVSDQTSTSIINGQYDWVNNKVWLGDLFGSDIYMYPGKGYYASGELISSAYNTGGLSSFKVISWDVDTPGSSSVKFQLRGGDDNEGVPVDWSDWEGPTDTGDYYTTSGSAINPSLIGSQWLQYKAYLTGGSTPTLNSVTISYQVDEHEPNPFHLTSPEKGVVIYTSSPALDWEDAVDPDGDTVTYTLWYSTSPDFVTKTEITSITESTYTLSGISDDTSYYWKVKAVDVYGKYRWSTETDWYLCCNAVNLAPSVPTLHSPADGSSVESLNPVLEVNNSSDTDPYDTLTYEFEVYTNSALTNLVASVSGAAEGESGITSWSVTPPLTFGQTYYWRVRASDGTTTSNWMTTASFTITTVGRWTQTDWSGGEGQTIWDDTSKYLSAGDMDGGSEPGVLLLGKTEGEGGEKQPVEGFSSISSYANEDDAYPDYRGESVSWWAYDGESLEWTAPVPSSYTHGKATLIWTATWNGDGTNTITINGETIFSDCANPLDSEDYTNGEFNWHFDYKEYHNGYNGVCYLTVPAAYSPADSSVSIKLTHSGGGWYMVKGRDDTISYEESDGALKSDSIGSGGIYCEDGNLTSSQYNTGSMSEFNTISWTVDVPGDAEVKFQLRGAPDKNKAPGEWTDWMGPTGVSDYYTISGSDINSALTGNQWIQYKAYFKKGSTPNLKDITVRYNIDDDQTGPAIYNFEPGHANTGTPFNITCFITDTSGVYDDSTGSGDQGVYLIWADNSGLSGGTEIQMSALSTDSDGNGTYITDSPISADVKGTIIYYTVSAYDNDFDDGHAEDRSQTISSVQSVIIGSKFIEIGVDSLQTAGVPFAVSLIAKIDTDGAISTDASYSGTAKISVDYINPSTGTKLITPEEVNFNEGVAAVEMVYPDCGTIKIKAVDTEDSTITGVSDEVFFAPHHLALTLPEPPIVVSKPFDIVVTAYNASDEVTPNYSQKLKLSVIYSNPEEGDGKIEPEEMNDFTDGIATVSAVYNRWGEVSIKVTDENTEGVTVEAESDGIMFIPEKFKLEISQIPDKRDFFYIGEVFRITVWAVDYEDETIPNYKGTVHFVPVSGISLPGDYTFIQGDSGKHIFPVSVNEEKGGLSLSVYDIDYRDVSGDVEIPAVRYGAIRVLSTSGPVGSLRVEVQVEDSSGNVIESDSSTTFSVTLEEEGPNGSAVCEESQTLKIAGGRAIITITNNEPETVTVIPSSTPYLEPISGKVSFGGIGADGIRIIHWEEER